MKVKFIAHAGIAIEENGYTILVDPWFTGSTLDQPILEGLSGIKTIDFQIPKAKDQLSSYTPNAILLSHFHAHHAPMRDILSLIENTYHDITLAHPDCNANSKVQERLQSFRHVTIKPVKNNDSFVIGPFTVTALDHTVPHHIAWLIKSATGHVLHLADSSTHKDKALKILDPLWEKFCNLDIDAVYMSTGRNSLRIQTKEEKDIIEMAAFSPIQAAKLIQKINPQVVFSIGTQNHSVWKNFTEFIPDTPSIEEELRWALEWLSPATKFQPIRPGHTLSIGEAFDAHSPIDTYLPS